MASQTFSGPLLDNQMVAHGPMQIYPENIRFAAAAGQEDPPFQTESEGLPNDSRGGIYSQKSHKLQQSPLVTQHVVGPQVFVRRSIPEENGHSPASPPMLRQFDIDKARGLNLDQNIKTCLSIDRERSLGFRSRSR